MKLALLIWLLAIVAVAVIASVILHATSQVVWVVPSYEEVCPHGMRPEWCADCREREAKEHGCGSI